MLELNDLPHVARITFQMVLAALLGGVIGFEREQKGKAAGLRTHMPVWASRCSASFARCWLL